MQVRCGLVTSGIDSYDVPDDATVGQVIELAGLDTTNMEIKLNGEPADLGTGVVEGDTILLATKAKGN